MTAPARLLVVAAAMISLGAARIVSRVKRNDFVNNYGYGRFGMGPTNVGVDSWGYYRDKFYNSGLPPLYTWSSYRNYYHEVAFHKNKYNKPVVNAFETLQQERFGPYYRGVWGYSDHSPYYFGKKR